MTGPLLDTDAFAMIPTDDPRPPALVGRRVRQSGSRAAPGLTRGAAKRQDALRETPSRNISRSSSRVECGLRRAHRHVRKSLCPASKSLRGVTQRGH